MEYIACGDMYLDVPPCKLNLTIVKFDSIKSKARIE